MVTKKTTTPKAPAKTKITKAKAPAKVKEAPVVVYEPVDIGAIVDKQIKAARTKLHKQIDKSAEKALKEIKEFASSLT